MEQQKTRRTLKYEFTPAEMLDLGRDLSAKNQELRQIEEQEYEEALREEGYQDILKYGVAFYKKECMAKMQK